MLKIENLNFKIGDFELKDISFEINQNEYFIILGPTGSGKTSLLKTILGIYKILSGKILLYNLDITNLPTEKREIGYLPQEYFLFPNMNVYENISFGLKIKKFSKKYVQEKVFQISELLNIKDILFREIKYLSGGEKQRVALARAIVTNPKLILLDEPFSSINESLKTEICFELKDILKKLNIPVIHITHNLDEAYSLADKIAVIINGTIMQVGTSEEIFNQPRNVDVARFLNIKNIFDAEVENLIGNNVILSVNNLKIVASKNNKNYSKKDKIKLCIKPEGIKIIKPDEPIRDELKDNIFNAKILSVNFYSDICFLKILLYENFNEKKLSSLELLMKFPVYIYKRHNLKNKENIQIGIWKTDILVY